MTKPRIITTRVLRQPGAITVFSVTRNNTGKDGNLFTDVYLTEQEALVEIDADIIATDITREPQAEFYEVREHPLMRGGNPLIAPVLLRG